MKKNYLFMALAAMVFTAAALSGCKKDDPEPVKVSSVAFKTTPSALTVGDEFTFEATVLPENAENKNVTWNSSDATVATVTAGVVKALAAGKSSITATAADGSGKKASFEVTVNEPEVASAVTIEGDGFDIDEQMTILASAQTTTPVKVDLASARGIDKLLVEITTSNEAFGGVLTVMGLGGEFDLANPGTLSTTLSDVNLPNGVAVKGKTALPFDISGFIPMIFLLDGNNGMTADFKLTVMDDKGVSETKTLQLYLVDDTQLLNRGFEIWGSTNMSDNSVQTWYPYPYVDSDSRGFWGTANGGLTMAGTLDNRNPTTPSDDVRPGSVGSKSAKMNSRYVKILFVQKFAAGNLFTGEFGKIDMAKNGATVHFGQPFTKRPLALKGWLKGNAGTIDHASAGAPKVVGDPDEYQIFVALTTWDARHQVDTWDQTTFMNPLTDERMIGFGEKSGTGEVADWTEFEIPITYSSDATPTHIVVVATSSKYGDFFTGSTESWLQVDDFELVYE